MTPIHVIGIGLDGLAGLSPQVQAILQRATLIVGSDRHLAYLPQHSAAQLPLTDLHATLQTLAALSSQPPAPSTPPPLIAVLTSGDPLFFGFGRLLLEHLPPEQLTFHPHLSSVQLAFSRVKVPWQDARLVSVHGRSLDELVTALQQGAEKIALLTDHVNTPGVIARLLLDLAPPVRYQAWVCENLGGESERVRCLDLSELESLTFDPLNVVVLLRQDTPSTELLADLPLMGIPDACFASFRDRPGLITKREIRLLVLGELALQPNQVVWDIGAGTGSVAVEIARLCPSSVVYAVEKTAAGIELIRQNRDRFHVANVIPIAGDAPAVLADLPLPHRVFIGGSGGNLIAILDRVAACLAPQGLVLLALATLEHQAEAIAWAKHNRWQANLLQANLSRSTTVAALTRFSPLNPVVLVSLRKPASHRELHTEGK
ncbi:MAG TPA: precorrin-6y C5,15-methyltransferase (decarboxylating) subunit CbiE [Synechococcales cyanobacterium M55_K2018_004]|nr:precorrin-6y C5,15-methyltransferase (decarboxylating) subunit CbiE [Synechococcales cyanobacterium M55_K2018_004]